jgi:hypothetical protein
LAAVYVQITSGTTPGPFNVYEQFVNASNLLESNVSAERLRAPNFQYTIQPTTTQLILVNMNPACRGNLVTIDVPNPATTPTPTITSTATPNLSPTLTQTQTATRTASPTPTSTATRTPTPTPPATNTPTPTTSQAARATVTVNLTIDSGNTGYTQIYTSGSAGYALQSTLLTNGSTYTFTVAPGDRFYTSTVQQTRAQSGQVAEAIFLINGSPDANINYIQTTLGAAAELISVPLYGGDGHPTPTYPNTYVVNTYIGTQR